MCCLLLQILIFMLRNITSVNIGAVITGVLCLGVLIGLKQVNERCRHRLKLPIPAELLVVMIFIVRVYLGGCKLPQESLSRGCFQRNKLTFWSILAFPLKIPRIMVERKEKRTKGGGIKKPYNIWLR